MENFIVYAIVQLNLVFGVAGMVWPEKMMPVFALFMFPWPATHRSIRVNGLIAIAAYLVVVGKLFTTYYAR